MLRLLREKSWPVAFAVSVLAPLPAQGPLHTRAVINDSRSHGKLGDARLSLNEGLLLHNQTLTRSQLSAAELKQIQGAGDIATLEIPAATVPKITLERDLVLVNGSQHGFTLEGVQGTPIIDFGAHHEIKIVGDYCTFRDLHFKGGQRAIHLTQNDALFGALFEDVHFEGQVGTALTVIATQSRGNTRMLGSRLRFTSVGTAIAVEDRGADRRGTVELADIRATVHNAGILVRLGPGGAMSYRFEKMLISGGTVGGIHFLRPSAADDRQVDFSGLHLRIEKGAGGFSFTGISPKPSKVVLRSVDFAGSRHALELESVEALVEDSRLSGSVSVRAPSRGNFLLANGQVTGAQLDVASAGASVSVTDSILNVQRVRLSGGVSLRIAGSRFIAGQLQGSSAAPILVDGCHLGGATAGSYTRVTNSLPAPQLGSMDATPLEQVAGGKLTLSADLPAGLAGFWVIGMAAPQPFIGKPPLHIYTYLPTAIALPTPVRSQNRWSFNLPRKCPSLDLFFHLAVVPDVGTRAPALSLPPGRRITVR